MRTPDFEDRSFFTADWPETLQALHRAAESVHDALDELDGETFVGDPDRLEVLALAGAAYELLKRIRCEGEMRLAAWECEQQLVASEADLAALDAAFDSARNS